MVGPSEWWPQPCHSLQGMLFFTYSLNTLGIPHTVFPAPHTKEHAENFPVVKYVPYIFRDSISDHGCEHAPPTVFADAVSPPGMLSISFFDFLTLIYTLNLRFVETFINR